MKRSSHRSTCSHLEVRQVACVEHDLEVDGPRPCILGRDGLPAPGVVAVVLDVHDAVEAAVRHVHAGQDAVRETVHRELGLRELSRRRRRRWNWKNNQNRNMKFQYFGKDGIFKMLKKKGQAFVQRCNRKISLPQFPSMSLMNPSMQLQGQRCPVAVPYMLGPHGHLTQGSEQVRLRGSQYLSSAQSGSRRHSGSDDGAIGVHRGGGGERQKRIVQHAERCKNNTILIFDTL